MITGVNGIRGEATQLMKECGQRKLLYIEVLRQGAPSKASTNDVSTSALALSAGNKPKTKAVLRTGSVRILSCCGRLADGRRTVAADGRQRRRVVSGAEKKSI